MNRYATLLFSALLAFSSCKKSASVTTPVRRDITQAVYASGKIFPVNDYKVFSKLPGYIEKIHIHVGDSVKIGQKLITIKSEVSGLNVTTAKNLLDLAQKNGSEDSPLLLALKEDVSASRTRYQLDSLNYTRNANLLKENAISRSAYDQARTQEDISKQNFLKAISNYQSAKDRVRVELENAQIQYQAQISNQNDYTITSAVNGKVMASINLQQETIIYSGMSVEANIIIAEKKNALVIPREFLVEGKKVKLKSTGELITVRKGAEDLQFVEVLDGIDEHTEIKKP
jgi:HlyD family secretion protein